MLKVDGDGDVDVLCVLWWFVDDEILMIVLNLLLDVVLFDVLGGWVVFEMLVCVCDWVDEGELLLYLFVVWLMGDVNCYVLMYDVCCIDDGLWCGMCVNLNV